ncbi:MULTISPECIES: hypothetical protein [unclassified Bradyrhizobium]|jgi:hypothetical protein|uniref:hypothetical protein n=1 Tax=unclassified Bradyrhizobium TaxID=2631580 RepID=UPI000418C2C4|nr:MULTISPECIES: hypothetical protein [unclassified Bradyrhizobium]QIG93231.1 hypothetical protein G6P99_12490 [Bradyrhizobium sp. 6(2017)]
MKFAFGAFLVACVVGYLYYIFPNPADGTVYPVPITQARQDLAKAELPPFVFGSQSLDVVRNIGDAQVVWIVRRKSEELFRYTAELSAEEKGAATRVKLRLDGAKGRTEDYAKNLADNPKIRDLYLVAMQERVASTLERRQFEMSRIHPAMAAAAVANMGNIRKSADEAAAAAAEIERSTIQRAYRNEPASVRR